MQVFRCRQPGTVRGSHAHLPPLRPSPCHRVLLRAPARASQHERGVPTEQPGPSPSKDPVQSSTDESSTPEPPPVRKPLFLRLLSSLQIPAWMSSYLQALKKKDGRAIQLARAVLIGAMFIGVALTRQVMDAKAAVRTREVLYSDFVKLLDAGGVRAVRLESGTGRMYFDVQPKPPTEEAAAAASSTAEAASTASTSGRSGPIEPFQRQYMVKLAGKKDYLLASKVLAAGVEFAVVKQSYMTILMNTFITALALWIPLLPIFFLFKRVIDERSQARKKKPDNKSTSVPITFKDVAGVDSAKEELMEVVTVMRAAKSSYTKLNVKIPSGVLLCGPPGTGKTLLAKAVAGEAGIPFFAFSASEFVELFVGRGAARIREVFAEARKAAPCVVFIDELDAVGARRGMGYNDERDQTLNQLLTELDGFEGRQGILFLAATNRMEILDPALLRPGRINRKVNVPLPSESGRRDILKVHLRSTPMQSDEEKMEACERLARVTQGFSGAELANVVNEGTLLAARKDEEVVTLRELLEGVQRTRFGVNGAAPGSGFGSGLQKWLMDLATAPDSKKVKNATA